MLLINNCMVIRMGFVFDIDSMDADATGNGIDFGPNLWLRAYKISENAPFSNFPMFRGPKGREAQILKIWFLPQLLKKYLNFTRKSKISQKVPFWVEFWAPFFPFYLISKSWFYDVITKVWNAVFSIIWAWAGG